MYASLLAPAHQGVFAKGGKGKVTLLCAGERTKQHKVELRVFLSLRFYPDAAFVHEVDLLLNDLLTILGVLHWFAV